MKYPSLKALSKAIASGEEKKAYCTYDKEFIAISSKRTSDPFVEGVDDDESGGSGGELLYECSDDHEFIIEALKALGVKAQCA